MPNRDDERAVLAQKIQSDRGSLRTAELEKELKDLKCSQKAQQEELEDMERLLDAELEKQGYDAGSLDLGSTYEDTEDDLSESEKQEIINKNREKYDDLKVIEYDNYSDYLQEVNKYLLEADIDIEKDPVLQIFSQDELKDLMNKYNESYGKLPWTKLDYIVTGAASVIAILLDVFIAAIPEDMNFLGKNYKGSPITKKLKEISVRAYEGTGNSKLSRWLHDGLKDLEKYAKVPYDISANGSGVNVDGLGPRFHRFMELGHDPILGFIFGVIDILRGTATIIDKNGVLQIISSGDKSFGIFSALLKEFAHLLSDICTKQGIAPPFMPLLQLITGKTPFILRKNGEKVGLNNVVRFMYRHGYDMRHMMTMSIVPLTVEFIIRTYYNLYYFDSLLDHEKDIRHICKKNNMLAVSHSVLMGGDIVKMWIYGWNPLAFNYSEFLMLVKTILSVCKGNKDYNRWLADELEKRWGTVLQI